jgi:hypothetical protein
VTHDGIAVVLRRWGAWAVVADGLVWLAYGLLTRMFAPSYWNATSFVDYLAVGLYAGGLLLLAVGLAAVHARQAGRAGLFGWVAFIVPFAGAIVAAVGDLAEDGLRYAPAVAAFFGGMLLLGAGLVLFGLATLRARVLPVGCGVLLLLSPVVGYPLRGLWSDWQGTVLFGLLWIALGRLLLLSRPEAPAAAASTPNTRG